jgi:hypothetical protein
MKNKSIISLISVFLLSMFYGASASAGPTYLHVEMPKKCGTWKVSLGPQHCSVRGSSSGNRGKDVAFKCVGGDNGKGGIGIDTQSCGTIIFSTANRPSRYSSKTDHSSYVLKGVAQHKNVIPGTWEAHNFHIYVVCPPGHGTTRRMSGRCSTL